MHIQIFFLSAGTRKYFSSSMLALLANNLSFLPICALYVPFLYLKMSFILPQPEDHVKIYILRMYRFFQLPSMLH